MKKWIFRLLLLLVILFGLFLFVFQGAMTNRNEGKAEAIVQLKKELPNAEVISSYHYVGKEEVWSFLAQGRNGVRFYVWVAEDKPVVVRSVDRGISSDKAEKLALELRNSAKVVKTTLGMENEIPFWEVLCEEVDGKLTYMYIGFETGELLKRYTLE
ncbi:MAG: hypothetical protein ACRC5C_02470 [Bacilli bacterium]